MQLVINWECSVAILEMSKYYAKNSKLSYLEENDRTLVKCREYSYLSILDQQHFDTTFKLPQ